MLYGHWRTKKSISPEPLLLPNSATAVAFQPVPNTYENLSVVIGLDDGQLFLADFDLSQGIWSKNPIKIEQGHHKTIKKLKFQPITSNSNKLLLATCGNDSLVQLLALSRNR